MFATSLRRAWYRPNGLLRARNTPRDWGLTEMLLIVRVNFKKNWESKVSASRSSKLAAIAALLLVLTGAASAQWSCAVP